ncbi:hypothetical protein D9M69_592740 [compost metagenome]
MAGSNTAKPRRRVTIRPGAPARSASAEMVSAKIHWRCAPLARSSRCRRQARMSTQYSACSRADQSKPSPSSAAPAHTQRTGPHTGGEEPGADAPAEGFSTVLKLVSVCCFCRCPMKAT